MLRHPTLQQFQTHVLLSEEEQSQRPAHSKHRPVEEYGLCEKQAQCDNVLQNTEQVKLVTLFYMCILSIL